MEKQRLQYKLIACDLDGTLLDDNSDISEKSIDAIKKISDMGVEFSLCTGRTYYEIPEKLRSLDSVRYIIYSDGAVIYDKLENKNILTGYFPVCKVKELYSFLSEYDTMIELFDGGVPKTDEKLLNDKSFEYFEIDPGYVCVIKETRKGVEKLAERLDEFDKTEIFNIFFKHLKERDDCFNKLKKFKNITFTTSMKNNIEITSKNVTKGSALIKLADYLKIDISETIAAGDSENDLTMLKAAGLSVAPSSAGDKIKKLCDVTSCSNNDSVPAYILREIL